MSDSMSVCAKCSASMDRNDKLCPECGPLYPETNLNPKLPFDPVTWEADIPLLTNPLILKQLLLVTAGAGFIMAAILSLVFALTGEAGEIPVMLMISFLTAAGFGLLLFLVALIYFGNRTRVRFSLSSSGVLWEARDKRVKSASRLAMVAGVLGGSLQAAGAGALAVTREKDYVSWKHIRSAEYNRRHLMIVLRNSWRPVMMIICLNENYDLLVGYIKNKVHKNN